jgi:hypothetical protein
MGDVEEAKDSNKSKSVQLASLVDDGPMHRRDSVEHSVIIDINPNADASTEDVPLFIRAVKLFDLLYHANLLENDCFNAESEKEYKFTGDKVKKQEEIIIKSTNDLYTSKERNIWHLLIAAVINGMQIALLYYASDVDVVSYEDLDTSYEWQLKVLLVPFCSAIISYNLVSDFDRKLKRVISQYFHHDITVDNNVLYDIFRVLLCLLALPIVSIITFFFRFRTGLIIAINQTVAAVLINASAKIIRSQISLQNVLFNFVGILGILQLDNVVAEMLNITLTREKLQYKDLDDQRKWQRMNKAYEANFIRITFFYYFILTMIIMYSL